MKHSKSPYHRQLARIHALKRDLAYTDEQYQLVLKALTGRTSSAMLTNSERDMLITHLTGFLRDQRHTGTSDAEALAILG